MKRLILSVLIFFLVSVPCFAGEPLQFIGIENMPPFAYEENGVIKGYDYDIFMEVMNRAGIPVIVTLLPAKRGGAYLMDGTVDGTFMLFYSEDRKHYVTFCDTPIHTASFQLFVRKDREFPFQSMSDLYGKRVGTQPGFLITPEFYDAVRNNNIVQDEALDIDMHLKKLLTDRIDCYVSSTRIIDPILADMELTDDIVPLPVPILPKRSVYIAVSNNSPNIKDIDGFIETWGRIREELDKDGTITRIDAVYFPRQAP